MARRWHRDTRLQPAYWIVMISIYRFTNTVNGKVYIGQSRRLKNRIRGHKYCATSEKYPRSNFIHKAMKKYGWDKFVLEVIETCDTQIEADLQEKFLIQIYCSADQRFGYNLALGGRVSPVVSDETRRRMSAAQKGRQLSEETKARLAAANKGKRHSDETRRKLSESRLGKKFSEERKARLRGARVGYTHSEETKEKMRAGHVGRVFTEDRKQHLSEVFKGRKFSDETIERMRSASMVKRKIKPDDVPDVMRLREEGVGFRKIAAMYGCSTTSVCRALRKAGAI